MGQVFVVAGDVSKVSSDAWLLPTDRKFNISPSFQRMVGGRTRLDGRSWNGRRVIWIGDEVSRAWLADIGGTTETDVRSFVDVVGQFATLVKQQGGPAEHPRRPVVALPALGTGEGGGGPRKGAVLRELIAAVYAAAEDVDVDVVLACWGRRAFAAAQRERRSYLDRVGNRTAWDLGEGQRLTAVAEAIADHVRRQHLVLFLGAGTSAGARLPLWEDLLGQIAAAARVTGDDLNRLSKLDFRDQASILQRRLGGPERLGELVAEKVHAVEYSLTHGLLASLRCREAVTTNYDPLFEEAMASAGRAPAVLPYQAVSAGEPWLLKLHGSADRPESIVLTRSDYLGVPATHGALFGLVQAMLLTRHMLFVGYSLSDEDFHQLVHDVRRAREHAGHGQVFGTVLTLFDDPLFRELWEDDLEIVPMMEQGETGSAEDRAPAAARRLNCLLDRVAFEAADVAAFLLDATYDDMLDASEQELATSLRAAYDSADPHSPVGARTRALLDELTAEELPGPDGSGR